jgi:hypothetical protein
MIWYVAKDAEASFHGFKVGRELSDVMERSFAAGGEGRAMKSFRLAVFAARRRKMR